MNFTDTKFSSEHRFSIGIEDKNNKKFLSFPVTVRHFSDFEAYYEIKDCEYELFLSDLTKAIPLLSKCREGKEENRRLSPPKDENEVPC